MQACALCKKTAPLRKSHIVPAFVFRWLRETSATGFLRSGMNPRLCVQDGLKLPLLCEICEQRFSRLEREFANRIFNPILRGGIVEVEYSDWFLKFCVSISWRILTYAVRTDLLDHFSAHQMKCVFDALAKWSEFLLEKVPHPREFEQRLVLLGGISSAPRNAQLQPNTNRYFLRGVDVDVAAADGMAFTYAKLGPFALFGVIKASGRWSGTKINANEGTVGPKSYVLPRTLFDYWMERADHFSQTSRSVPESQQSRIEAEIIENPQRYLESETFTAMKQDVSMFGTAAFWNHSKK